MQKFACTLLGPQISVHLYCICSDLGVDCTHFPLRLAVCKGFGENKFGPTEQNYTQCTNDMTSCITDHHLAPAWPKFFFRYTCRQTGSSSSMLIFHLIWYKIGHEPLQKESKCIICERELLIIIIKQNQYFNTINITFLSDFLLFYIISLLFLN